MSEQQLDRVAHLLNAVVEGFFLRGEIPGEAACACAAIASDYVNQMRGEDLNCGLIDLFESTPGCVPIMYAEDQAIQQQITQREKQLDMLRNSSHQRYELVMAPLGPDQQPMPPVHGKKKPK